jgi:acyl transferase domain-containing protein
MNLEDSHDPSSDIAIIGYAARFPGAENAAEFWANLCQGVESIRSFTAEELESVGVSKSILKDPDYVRAGAPLSHIDAFDAAFFGISPREAAIMDPQQRFFLESAWEALEHAGYAPGTFRGSTGVFAGSGPNSYLIDNLLSDQALVDKEGMFLLRHTGNDKDVLATRVSYQMDLRGPSLNIQTACSTSLVAIHYACQSLLHLGCDMALAGAVTIEIPHAVGYQYRQNEIQSHDGHCRAFDANATGTVFASGVGIVVLRRLSDALAARDTIHAVIKGTAVNNDGSRRVGFLAPSVEGQVEVIQEAIGVAGVTPSSIDFVETHGTGTPIGDPIELSALSRAFASRQRPLKIGSVKNNIGHLDTAAGMASVLKTVLALQHRQIPPTLHFKTLNPLVDTSKTKLEVVDRLTDWEAMAEPRRAGVTSLGIGGTNAHIILEEAPPALSSESKRPVRLFTLSAKTAPALEEAMRNLASHLRHFPDENLDDIAHTLHVGRNEFVHRRMFVARDRQEAMERAELRHGSTVATGKSTEQNSVAFLFSGHGGQYCKMGQELYQTEPVFREWIDTCATLAHSHIGFDFRELLFPTDKAAEAEEQIKLTWNAQPILFAIEYALAQLWISWGIRPTKLIGYSLGEYAAACLSGVFSLEDAIALVCARGNLMKKTGKGAMLAVSFPEAEVTRRLKEPLSLAAVDSFQQCVISGPVDDVLALKAELDKAGITSLQLDASHAFHSAAIDPLLKIFTEIVQEKQLHAPRIPLISSVTGTWLTEQEATDPAYWARHFRDTMRFSDGLKELLSSSVDFLIEIGPGDVLCTLGRQSAAKDARQKFFPSLPKQNGEHTDLSTMLTALGNLWVSGVKVDWKVFHAHEQLHRVPLPTYPFQRRKFWMGPKIGTNWLEEPVESPLSPVTSRQELEPSLNSVTGKSDEIESALAQLWQQLLGLEQVDATTDFFDSGGHSLLAVRLFTEIRKRFNINFGLSTLFEARTIGSLAELIRKARESDTSSKGTSAGHTLVPIRPRGTNTPLFLIHDVGGSVLRYEHLARHFPEDQAIYAIESRGLSGLPSDFNVEDMATHYIQQIRERQPQGPYFVAGHSFGGLVTYEIARQLTAQNEKMGLVGLLDTFQRPITKEDYLLPSQPLYTGKLPFLKRLFIDTKSLILGRDRVGYLQERRTYIQAWFMKTLYRTAHKVSSRTGWKMPSFLNDVKEANWIALDYFVPGTYDGTVVLFRCMNRLDTDPPDSTHVWRRLVKGEVVLLEVPGDHNSMLREPGVRVLAEQMLSYLKPVNAEPADSSTK